MIPGAIPLAKNEWRPGVYFLIEGDIVRYVGSSIDPVNRSRQHRIHIPYDKVMFIPVKGQRNTLREVERCFIVQLQPTHNRQDNPNPGIDLSVTTKHRESVMYRVWVNRALATAIKKAAKDRGKTPIQWLRDVADEAVKSKKA